MPTVSPSLKDYSDGEAPVLEIWKVVEYLFITITQSSMLTWSGSTNYKELLLLLLL